MSDEDDDFDVDYIHKILDVSAIAYELKKNAFEEFYEKTIQEVAPKTQYIIVDHYIKQEEAEEIIKETVAIDEDGYYNISIKDIPVLIDKMHKRIFFKYCKALEEQGVLEMIFDSETNDFAWKLKNDQNI